MKVKFKPFKVEQRTSPSTKRKLNLKEILILAGGGILVIGLILVLILTSRKTGEEEPSKEPPSIEEPSSTEEPSEEPSEPSSENPDRYTPVLPTGRTMNPQGNVTVPSWITQCLLTIRPQSRPGLPISSVQYVVIHYAGNANTTAAGNWEYFETHDNNLSVSSHFFIGLEGEILQCVPLNEIAYAQGSEYNPKSISIECCHPTEDGKFNEKTYASAVKTTAWLLEAYGLDSSRILRHFDCTGKCCPLYYCPYWLDGTPNPNGPVVWEQFKDDVRSYMEAHPDIQHEFQ